MPVIHWFRRDLRLTDNTALTHAIGAHDGSVIPVFVFDEALLRGKAVAPVRVAFLLESLKVLDAQLRARGGRLILRRGDPVRELSALARECGASALYFNKDYTPAARRRDSAVEKALSRQGVEVKRFKDAVVFEEHDVLTGSGTPYTVFTPYKRAWLARPRPQPVETPEGRIAQIPDALKSLPMPTARELGFESVPLEHTPGEVAGAAQLQRWLSSEAAAEYDQGRNLLALEGTSKLSPHLRFGTVSPRVCVEAAEARRKRAGKSAASGFETWISELIWREFYQQILFHFPHADTGNFRPVYDALVWGNGSAAKDDALFEAWCAGRTGFPIVDAAMRQLNTTGWMHNRARMITASFLTKDLLIDWRRGERYFMQKLVDGDPAANNGGWQWASSTGTDAQPYFRVFNPRLQSERFDPHGDYIRRYVPELAGLQGKAIHAPAEMTPMDLAASGVTLGEAYPEPIVDHATQKDEIVRRFKAIKGA